MKRGADDLLEMRLGELLLRLVEGAPPTEADPWIDPRSDACPVPYRTVLQAGNDGELELSKFGRKLLVRKSELDRWIESHRIRPRAVAPAQGPAEPPSAVAHILVQAGYSKRRVGHGD